MVEQSTTEVAALSAPPPASAVPEQRQMSSQPRQQSARMTAALRLRDEWTAAAEPEAVQVAVAGGRSMTKELATLRTSSGNARVAAATVERQSPAVAAAVAVAYAGVSLCVAAGG